MPRTGKPRSSPAVRARARELRQPPTPAERILWEKLRDRRSGWKFRRQTALGPFIVDFYRDEARLVVQLDGESHDHATQAERDEMRTEWLEDRGYRVLRFWSQDVLRDTDSVIAAIVEALTLSSPSPAPRERGRGCPCRFAFRGASRRVLLAIPSLCSPIIMKACPPNQRRRNNAEQGQGRIPGAAAPGAVSPRGCSSRSLRRWLAR